MQAEATAMPVPVTLATGRPGPYDIAVDGSYVYWTEQLGGAVMRVQKGGGTPQLVGAASQPLHLVLDSDYVYWNDNGGVERAAKAGGGTMLVAAPVGSIVGVGVDDNNVFAVGTNYLLWRAPKDGSGSLVTWGPTYAEWPMAVDSVVTAIGEFSPVDIALRGPFLLTKAGTQVPHIGFAHYYLQAVKAYSPFVYSAGADGEIGQPQTIRRVHECGEVVGQLILSEPNGQSMASIALDSEYVYWTNTSGNTIYRTPR
jgi:hypothetical protein